MNLLRRCVKSAEAVTHEIGVSRDRLHERMVTLNAHAAGMFVAMHSEVCPFEQARI